MGPQLPDRRELQVLIPHRLPHSGPAAQAAGLFFFMRAFGTLAGLPSTLVTIHAVKAAAAGRGCADDALPGQRPGWPRPRPCTAALAAGRRIAVRPPPTAPFPRAGDACRRAPGSRHVPARRPCTMALRSIRIVTRVARLSRASALTWPLAGPRRRSACGARWPLPGGTHFRTRARDAERRRGGDRSPPLRAASRVATLSRAVRSTPRGPAMPVRRLRTGPRPGRACPAPASGRRAADAVPARPTG